MPARQEHRRLGRQAVSRRRLPRQLHDMIFDNYRAGRREDRRHRRLSPAIYILITSTILNKLIALNP